MDIALCKIDGQVASLHYTKCQLTAQGTGGRHYIGKHTLRIDFVLMFAQVSVVISNHQRAITGKQLRV